MMITLTILHFAGMFVIDRIERVPMLEEQKQFVTGILSKIFKTGIFILFAIVHFINILFW